MNEFRQIKIDAPQGVNFAIEPSQLNPKLWDDAYNVEFKHGKTKKVGGYAEGLGQALCLPKAIIPLRDENQDYYWWSYAGPQKYLDGSTWKERIAFFQVKDAATHKEVTPTVAPKTVGYWNNVMSGDALNGVPYYCYEKPYVWSVENQKFELMNKFPEYLSFRTMKTFKNFLVGLNFHTASPTPEQIMPGFSSDWEPQTHQNGIWWSHTVDTAAHMQVPEAGKSLWCDADPHRSSGWINLGGAGGPILDGKTLGDSLIVYREGSVWEMRFTGGQSIMGFRELFSDVGVLNSNCVADVSGQHFVVGHSDIYVHNGNSKQSIADGTVAMELFTIIDENHIDKVFATVNYDTKEFIVAIPVDNGDDTYDGSCNVCFVYNYHEQTWSRKHLPNAISAAYTILSIPPSTDTWEDVEEGGPLDANNNALNPDVPGCTWDELVPTEIWANASFKYSAAEWGLVYGSTYIHDPEAQPTHWEDAMYWDGLADWYDADEISDVSTYGLYTATDEAMFNGQNFVAHVSKSWMDLEDQTKASFVNMIYPEVRDGVVEVEMGGTYRLGEMPVYRKIGTYDPTLMERLDCRISGNYIHVKFTIPERSRAVLSGYTLSFNKIGRR